MEGELSGITIGSKGRVVEFDASGRVHLSDRLAASGGYRYVSIKAKDGLDFFDLRVGGWQFGLEISL